MFILNIPQKKGYNISSYFDLNDIENNNNIYAYYFLYLSKYIYKSSNVFDVNIIIYSYPLSIDNDPDVGIVFQTSKRIIYPIKISINNENVNSGINPIIYVYSECNIYYYLPNSGILISGKCFNPDNIIYSGINIYPFINK